MRKLYRLVPLIRDDLAAESRVRRVLHEIVDSVFRIIDGDVSRFDGSCGKASDQIRIIGDQLVTRDDAVAHQPQTIIGEPHQIELAAASFLKNGELCCGKRYVKIDLLEEKQAVAGF